YAAATASCRSTSTCRAARRRRKPWFTASCNCRRRSTASALSRADQARRGTAMTEPLESLSEHLAAAFPQDVTGIAVAHGELVAQVRREAILRVLAFLRDDPRCLFTVLVDICGADYPDRTERFDVIYNLLSLRHNQRIRLKLATDEQQPVPSATGLFSG